MRIGLAAFTANGRILMGRITETRPKDSFVLFDTGQTSAKEWARHMFASCDALFFIGATGIALRLIAPLVTTKDKDPAVLVIDEKGRFVIPLLSGHIGGANRLARELATAIGAEPVITTATDINGIFAVDEWSTVSGCVIDDIRRIKDVSAALLAGHQVGFHSDFPVSGQFPAGLTQERACDVGVCVSLDAKKTFFPVCLNVIPRIVVLGAGCRKETTKENFEQFVLNTMEQHAISPKALQKIVSIDLKKHEGCLLAFAEKYELPFLTFTAEELACVKGVFTGSEFVQGVTGVDNVCERSAILGGGENFFLPKTKNNGMTMALAMPNWVCPF